MRPLFPGGEVTLEQALENVLPKQQQYISATQKFADYTGGYGSGKSVVLCSSLMLLGYKQPGSMILIGRNTIPDLKTSTRQTFLEMVPEEWCAGGIRGWKPSEGGGGNLHMANGTLYLFRHLDVSDQKNNAHLKAMNLTAFGIDEGGEVQEEAFMNLQGRLRRKNTPIRWGRVVGNPAGRDWRWRKFHDRNRSEYFKQNFLGIAAPTGENIHLPQDYEADLRNSYPEDWVARYVDASFADMEDAVYKEWDDNIHTWDPEIAHDFFGGSGNPPAHWPVYVGVDIGGVDPWAFSFIAQAPNGMFFKYDEIHEPGILIKTLADMYWGRAEKVTINGLAYDWENQQAAYELEQYHIRGTPANKEVRPGIFSMGHYLHVSPLRLHPFTGLPGAPLFYVSQKCTNTRQEYASYKWAKDRRGIPTGIPADGNDHQVSADRYAMHTFKPVSVAPPTPKKSDNPDLDPASRMYWRNVEKQEAKVDLKKKRWSFRAFRRPGMKRRKPVL